MGTLQLATTWYGAFLLEDGKVREQRLFDNEPEAIAQGLSTIRAGDVLEEEALLAEGHDEVVVATRRLLQLSNARIGAVPVEALSPADHGFSHEDLRQAALQLARATIREELGDAARHLMQAVSYLDESHEVENLMGERLVAWLTLHVPEAVDAAKDHGELASLVVSHEDRDALLAEVGVTESLGAAWAEREAKAIRGLAQALLDQIASRRPLESFIEASTRDMAPNLSTLVGPTIAARLIHHAGGLTELAKMPSSTVQTLGAEKALFRHFTEGAPPPKHGVIFQHPLIHRAHPKDRGSIARAMASKASIAARVDAFAEEDKQVGSELKAELEARADEVARIGRRRAMAKRGRSDDDGKRGAS